MRFGFTLVELSVVLVILGLLVGGIMGGQHLIKSAEKNSIVKQSEAFLTADKLFIEKYMAIAGDMTNATQIWGAAAAGDMAACGPSLPAAVGTTRTCNGYFGDGALNVISAATAEFLLYWHHMKNAGFVAGPYNGIAGSMPFINATNSPTGKIQNTFWQARTVSPDRFVFAFGKLMNHAAGTTVQGNTFTPAEAMELDTKLDNGLPNTGKLKAAHDTFGGANACSTGTAATDTYILDNNDPACWIRFVVR